MKLDAIKGDRILLNGTYSGKISAGIDSALTSARHCHKLLGLVIILAKILIIISSIGLIRCSERFRTASREFDDQAIATLKHIMHVSEEMGIPRSITPLLILLTILCSMLSMHAIETALR